MEKLTCILAIVDQGKEGLVVLDKAVAIARRFGARVELMVPDFVQMLPFARRCTELGYDQVTLSGVTCGRTPQHELIVKRVLAVNPDLILKARGEGSAPDALADRDWQLATECPVPVMLVCRTPWAIPTRFATALDLENDEAERLARVILHTAGFLALGCRGNLDILYSEREQNDERLRMERAVKLSQLVREFHVGCERIQMYSGAPEDRLPPLAAARQYDVLILGLKRADADRHSHRSAFVTRMTERAGSDLVLVRSADTVPRHSGARAPFTLQATP